MYIHIYICIYIYMYMHNVYNSLRFSLSAHVISSTLLRFNGRQLSESSSGLDCLMPCDCLIDCLETFKLLGYARIRQSRPHFGLGFRVKVRFSLSAHVVSSTLLRFDCCQLSESSPGLSFT